MKTLSLFVLSTTCVALFSSSAALAQNAAIVNGKAIPKAQLDSLVKKSGQPVNDPQVREKAREVLITRELIIQEANNRGLTQKEAVKDKIEQSRIGILVAAVFEDFVEREGVTEAELKAAYASIQADYTGKEYQVKHILVAKQNSKDPGSAPNGGDLGWVSDKSLVPEFSKAMVALNKGQMTDKPVKSQFGWHIIRVDDVRDAKAPPMDEIKAELKQILTADENWQKAKFSEMMQKLRAKAKVQ
jgi:peptidyl-prolyl cis-trans isomerase C